MLPRTEKHTRAVTATHEDKQLLVWPSLTRTPIDTKHPAINSDALAEFPYKLRMSASLRRLLSTSRGEIGHDLRGPMSLRPTCRRPSPRLRETTVELVELGFSILRSCSSVSHGLRLPRRVPSLEQLRMGVQDLRKFRRKGGLRGCALRVRLDRRSTAVHIGRRIGSVR